MEVKFFDIDGPVVQFLSKVADLMWLNILTIVCCIPVITIGASLTALNYMALKIVRNEETYITKGFFKAFKENFKQSTVIWLIFMVLFSVIYVDYRIVLTTDVQIGNLLRGLIVMVVVLISYVKLQYEVTSAIGEVAGLESRLADLKESNDETLGAIEGAVNLDEIKYRAITELGMTYADEGQVISYENEIGDYVRQVSKVDK